MSDSHKFTKTMTDYAPGTLWMVRERVRQHREKFGGRAPAMLILHTGTLRNLFAEYAKEQGFDVHEMPPVENCLVGSLDGINFYHCRCGKDMAPDLLRTCEGEHEDL